MELVAGVAILSGRADLDLGSVQVFLNHRQPGLQPKLPVGADPLFVLGVATRFWPPSASRQKDYPWFALIGFFGVVFIQGPRCFVGLARDRSLSPARQEIGRIGQPDRTGGGAFHRGVYSLLTDVNYRAIDVSRRGRTPYAQLRDVDIGSRPEWAAAAC